MEKYIDEQNRFELIERLVSRVFDVEEITFGSKKDPFFVRYKGRLRTQDSETAYEQLDEQLKPLQITPLFRWSGKKHEIRLIEGRHLQKPSNPIVNLVLFILTFLSVMFVGFSYGLNDPNFNPGGVMDWIVYFFQKGWPFAVSIIAILGAHEFGHYLAGRYHKVNVTLPYFIPMPFSPFGTMGAFINMKEVPRNKKILLDIGIAGPLAGFIVCIPILIIGLSLSGVSTLPVEASQTIQYQIEGNSLTYLLAKYAVFGQFLPHPVDYGNLHPVLYWLKYIFTGRPLPLGGMDVMLHPVAWAGWIGLLVTGLNLIPAGQLDGGHIAYVLFGRKTMKRVFPFIIAFLVIMGFVWSGWFLWAFLLLLLGRVNAEPLDLITPLDDKRKIFASVGLVLFFLTFTPIPLILF